MKPVEQRTNFDCMRACLASIFECEYGDGPALTVAFRKPAPRWLEVYNDWCAARGYWPFTIHAEGEPLESPWFFPCYWLAGVRSPRWEGTHALVMHGRDVAWDPHPERDAVAHRGFVDCDVFVPLDVARLTLAA